MQDLLDQIKTRYDSKIHELESLQKEYDKVCSELDNLRGEHMQLKQKHTELKNKWQDFVGKIVKEVSENAISSKSK